MGAKVRAGPALLAAGLPPRVPAMAVSRAVLAAVAVAAVGGLLAVVDGHRGAKAVVPAARDAGAVPHLTVHGPRFQRAGARHVPTPPAGPVDPDREIARLAERAPAYRERLRQRYVEAGDLYRFLHEILPDAESGERAAQYYVYLTVSQCQMYLRLDAEGAQEIYDRMMLLLNDRPAEERLQWQRDYDRCRGFAGSDLGPLRAAMGDELPGSENEYASIWFQRAAQAGYPAALAEGALRINTLAVSERRAMLEEALAGGDAEIYWMLFYHSPADIPGGVTPAGAAWLLLACRSGLDCSRNADWFRNSACLQDGENCAPGESALEHYWYRLPAHERESAWHLAARIDADRRAGRFADMPWPELAARNIVDRRAGDRLD